MVHLWILVFFVSTVLAGPAIPVGQEVKYGFFIPANISQPMNNSRGYNVSKTPLPSTNQSNYPAYNGQWNGSGIRRVNQPPPVYNNPQTSNGYPQINNNQQTFNGNPLVSNPSGSPQKIITMGTCGANDDLIIRSRVSKQQSFWRPDILKKILKFPGSKTNMKIKYISCIRVMDETTKGNGGHMRLIGGGVKSPSVEMEFTSNPNMNIDLGFEIWGEL